MSTTVDVSTLFAKTDAGRAAIAEVEAQREAERQGHADEIKRLQTASQATRPSLTKALVVADAKLEKAKAALEKARRNLRLSQVALHNHNARLALAIEPHTASLVQTADLRIDQFIFELDQLTDETRQSTVQMRTESVCDILGREKPGKAYSTYAAICRRLDAIREARANALAMKTRVGIDVAVEIAKLRAGISEIDISKYEEI